MRYAIGLALLLSACAPTVDGTELGGVTRWTGMSPTPAVAAANAHCQRYGRIARVTQVDGLMGYVTFSCDRAS